MGYGKVKQTEHGGAKNGGGHWGTREEAKLMSKKLRRTQDRQAVKSGEAASAPDSPQV